MKTNIIFTCLILLSVLTKGQTDSAKNLKYRCNIDLVNPSGFISGELYSIQDSSLIIMNSNFRIEDSILYMKTPGLYKIPASRIDDISVWKKGATGRGFLYGAFAGAMMGALIGIAVGNGPPQPGESFTLRFSAGERAAIGGITGFLGGGLIGLAVGSIRVSIPIDGKKEKFELHRKEFQAYLEEK